MVHDSDGFNRWEAGQTLALRYLNENPDDGFIQSYRDLVATAFHKDTDKALLARSLSLPDVSIIGQHRNHVDPSEIHESRENLLDIIRSEFGDKIIKIYDENNDPSFASDFQARSRRALKNVALRLLDDPARARRQYENAHNMTDRVAALALLADSNAGERMSVFEDFYRRFEKFPLVIDKWFALQAGGVRPETLSEIRGLRLHPAFTMKNPNRVRSLYGAFAMNNPVCFHAANGEGYAFLADAIIELNGINPQIAARLLTPLKDWKRYTINRQKIMKDQLQRIANAPKLSADVFEIVNKTLAA